jgi:hypothetical protein
VPKIFGRAAQPARQFTRGVAHDVRRHHGAVPEQEVEIIAA